MMNFFVILDVRIEFRNIVDIYLYDYRKFLMIYGFS